MTAKLFEITIPSISLATIGIDGIVWYGTSSEPSHPHDSIGNWLWDDGGCILWDDGGAIAL